MRKIIDIGANLTDDVFRGLYRGKQAHPSDVESVIGRARSIGMDKMIITAGTVEDAREAVQLAKTSDMVWSFRSLIRILTLLITSFTRPLEFTRPDVIFSKKAILLHTSMHCYKYGRKIRARLLLLANLDLTMIGHNFAPRLCVCVCVC